MNSDTGRVLRADAARNRAAVIASAREIFSLRGVDAPLDEIARAASVSPGTLYRHFPTRADLVASTVADHFAELHTDSVRLLNLGDELDAIRQWIRLIAEYTGTYAGLPDSVLTAAPNNDAPFSQICMQLESITYKLADRAKASARLHADVTGEDIFVLATSLAWADDHDVARSRSENRLDILMRGIASQDLHSTR